MYTGSSSHYRSRNRELFNCTEIQHWYLNNMISGPLPLKTSRLPRDPTTDFTRLQVYLPFLSLLLLRVLGKLSLEFFASLQLDILCRDQKYSKAKIECRPVKYFCLTNNNNNNNNNNNSSSSSSSSNNNNNKKTSESA